MRFLASLSLAFKLALVLSLVVAGVAATIGSAMVNRDRERLEEELRGKAVLIARSVAVTAPEALLRSDTWTLYKMLRQLTQGPDGTADPSLIFAMILDTQGRVLPPPNPAMFPVGLPLSGEPSQGARTAAELANSEPSVFFDDRHIEASAPIQSSGKTLGLARVRLSSLDMNRRIAE